jgi:hypothetical protein
VSVLVASVAIGLVLGWAAVPRLAAPPYVWLLHMAGAATTILIAGYASPLLSSYAFAGAATSFALRAMMLAALYQRKV